MCWDWTVLWLEWGFPIKRGDGSGILQRGADDFCRIEHAGLAQVFVFAGEGVVSKGVVFGVIHLAGNKARLRLLPDRHSRRPLRSSAR